MTRRRRPLLVLPTTAAIILLSGCGDDAPEGDAPPSSPATAGETTVAPEGQSGSDQQADLEFEDQSGDGSSVVVDTVSAPQGGFVVVTAEGSDVPLGSVRVQVGTTDDAEVPLDAPLTADTDLTATLYADTDGDGGFDPSADQAVPEPISGDDSSDDTSDDSDVVDDGAEYSLR
ncbi:DUF7282 domain-containing protein [Modestobacter altitudinis]|uniref:DUF7282 domain-containing protein n=1 Tax=Modestobacter altitudinis TaxID=2213158 RepID=UPI00110CD1FD|nr:hypothetical protein [Modestobacter altitudinis]